MKQNVDVVTELTERMAIKTNSDASISDDGNENQSVHYSVDSDDDDDDDDDDNYDCISNQELSNISDTSDDISCNDSLDENAKELQRINKSGEVSDFDKLSDTSELKIESKDSKPMESLSSCVQKLSLTNLKFRGKTGTYVQRHLFVTLHCTRCRMEFDWKFQIPDNHRNKSSTVEWNLRSLPPHTTHCVRCRQVLGLTFEASIVHAFNNCIGMLYLRGCIADDIPSKHSETILSCVECNYYIRLSSMEPGRAMIRRCYECHSLIGLEFENFSLELIKQAQSDHNSNLVKETMFNSTQLSRKGRRVLNPAQNSIIREGTALPAFGTCKHYRKSHRWLRFPCCGHLRACDVCHDNSATDGHEMELATRMVCGYCSKEQPFSNSKPCVKCGKVLSGIRSTHWEGGKGCRNKLTMSKKDSKKYSQLNKTVSKK